MTRERRTVGTAAVLLALAAVALWSSSRMTWVSVTSFDGLGVEQDTAIVGGTWAAATTPLAIAAIAAVAALFAIRGRWSILLAILVALVGLGAAIPAVQLIVGGAEADRGAALAELPGRAEVVAIAVSRAPAALALLGAVLALLAALVILRSTTTRTGLSSKYDSPAVRREKAEREALTATVDDADVSERALWDALDSGVDPTVPSDTDGSPRDDSSGGTEPRGS